MPVLTTISKWCVFGALALSATSTFACWGCHRAAPINTQVGFVTMSTLPAGTNAINPIRLQALQETAYTLGARGALAWHSLAIDNSLLNEARQLDHVFDFSVLLINGDVVPPVIQEGDDSLNLSSPDALRTATKIYKILTPAQFTTTAPTWRTYLWMIYPKPTMPDHTLLPTTQPEAAVWNASLGQGWQQGSTQADEIFAVNLNRLKRDYVGMVLYRRLLDQHMISAPFVANANLGVTGNSQEIRINDAISRITQNSALQPDSSKWTPVLTDPSTGS